MLSDVDLLKKTSFHYSIFEGNYKYLKKSARDTFKFILLVLFFDAFVTEKVM